MTCNDQILIDGILAERMNQSLPSDDMGEVFELFAHEQILKNYDLSPDELSQGWIDGRRDGGVDGLFIFVNGHLLDDPSSFSWPKSNSEITVEILTVKHAATFKEAVLDKLISTLSEVFDLSLKSEELKGAYSEELLRSRSFFYEAYRRLAPKLSALTIKVSYVTRGDSNTIGSEVSARADQLRHKLQELFRYASVEIQFTGSKELLDNHRIRPSYDLSLPFEKYASKGEKYILLCTLSDYFRFVSDKGKLRRYLFDSNVRDYVGQNRVNEDILRSLTSDSETDFWWLNNGITIVSTSATIVGNSIRAENVQIVNGLQTTECIYRYFSTTSLHEDRRCILVKLLVTDDESIRTKIVRATNNQTSVELASLRATDRIQKNIEDALFKEGLYYERRKNFFVNSGKDHRLIVSPIYLAAGYVSLILKKPHLGTSLKSRFMKSDDAYSEVFNESVPIGCWSAIARVLLIVDSVLKLHRPPRGVSEKFLKGWRQVVSITVVAMHFGRFDFSAQDLARLDQDAIELASVEYVVKWLKDYAARTGQVSIPRVWRAKRILVLALEKFAERHGLAHVECVTRTGGLNILKGTSGRLDISEELIEDIRSKIPSQPWKPGIHKIVCEEVGCSVDQYFAITRQLIDAGEFYYQKDGILYDEDGRIVRIDEERVDPETLQLKVR